MVRGTIMRSVAWPDDKEALRGSCFKVCCTVRACNSEGLGAALKQILDIR